MYARTTRSKRRSRPAAPEPETPTAVTSPVPAVSGIARLGAGADLLGGTMAEPGVVQALQRRRGQGRQLPAAAASRMQEQFGHDFGDVRVHTDSEADRIARSVQATAFTSGQDIYFTSGTFAPGSTSGAHLLAHELAHVVQGGHGGPVIGRADDPAEAHADRMADTVVDRIRRHAAPTRDAVPAGGQGGAIRRVTNAFGVTAIAKIRESKGKETGGGDETVLTDLDNLAEALQKTALMAQDPQQPGFSASMDAPATDYAGQESFNSAAEAGWSGIGLGAVAAGATTVGGALRGWSGVRNIARGYHGSDADGGGKQNSLYKNLGAVSLENAVTRGVLSGAGGGLSTATDIAAHAGSSAIPFAGDAVGIYQAGVKTKSSVEDAVAADKLRIQAGKAKREMQVMAPGSPEAAEARSLHKFAQFGRRRKAETAAVNAVEGAGSAVTAAGTFAAAGDYGATKATGLAIKSSASGYKGGKSLIKRGRRVHKLRTAKNEIGYSSKTDRSFVWGTRAFFTGDLAKQMGKARDAVNGGNPTPQATAMNPAAQKAVIRKLTTQCQRRINELLGCLASDNATIRHRAKAILHVVAETNLAGSLQKIKDSDLDRFYALAQRTAANPQDAKAAREYERQRAAIKEIISTQLAGIGG